MQQDNISTNNFEQCLKCDLCTTVCPMMAVNPNYPGPKQAGPDGERYRMKDPAFYDLALKYCLGCRRCEVACPSGVNVGDIIQNARLAYGRRSHPLRDRFLASIDAAGSFLTSSPSLAAALSKSRFAGKILDGLGICTELPMPQYAERKFTDVFPDQTGYDRYVGYFHGCYVNYNNPGLGLDFVRLMNACGYGVRLLDGEKCCGKVMISNGMKARAKQNAKANSAAIRKALADGVEAVLTTSASCTFTIRQGYDHQLGMPLGAERSRFMMAVKWLYRKIDSGDIKLAFREGYSGRLAYHTACHMQRLGWAVHSIDLLKMVPGLDLSVLDQECCGMAGVFGFKKENYEYSQRIGAKLFNLITESGADAVATDCETCKWQIEAGTGIEVLNPITVLAEALDYERTKELNRK